MERNGGPAAAGSADHMNINDVRGYKNEEGLEALQGGPTGGPPQPPCSPRAEVGGTAIRPLAFLEPGLRSYACGHWPRALSLDYGPTPAVIGPVRYESQAHQGL